MDTKDIRRAKLAQLIEGRYKSQADFVEKTGINQGEASALLSGKKSFGEKKARKIEADSNLPVGWLDQIDGEVPEAPPPLRAPESTIVSNALNLACETANELRMLSVYRLAGKAGREIIDIAVDEVSSELDLSSVRNEG